MIETKSRDDINAFIEYVGYSTNAMRLETHPIQQEFDSHRRLVFQVVPQDVQLMTHLALRIVWELGRNPGLRIGIGCRDNDQSGFLLNQVLVYLSNIQVRSVFPDLEITSGYESRLTVDSHRSGSDPSLRRISRLDMCRGSRFDLIILDRVYDNRDCYDHELMNRLLKWINNIQDHIVDGGRIWMVCNDIHANDLGNRLSDPALKWAVVGGR